MAQDVIYSGEGSMLQADSLPTELQGKPCFNQIYNWNKLYIIE